MRVNAGAVLVRTLSMHSLRKWPRTMVCGATLLLSKAIYTTAKCCVEEVGDLPATVGTQVQ